MSPSTCSSHNVIADIWASERKLEWSWRFVKSPTFAEMVIAYYQWCFFRLNRKSKNEKVKVEKTKVKKVRVKSENVVMKRRTPYFVRFSCLRFLLASSGPIHYTKRAKFPPSKVIYKPFCVFKDQVHSQEPHPPLSSHRWSISPAGGEVLFFNISEEKSFTQQRSKSRARHTADHLSRALSYQELNLLANST